LLSRSRSLDCNGERQSPDEDLDDDEDHVSILKIRAESFFTQLFNCFRMTIWMEQRKVIIRDPLLHVIEAATVILFWQITWL